MKTNPIKTKFEEDLKKVQQSIQQVQQQGIMLQGVMAYLQQELQAIAEAEKSKEGGA